MLFHAELSETLNYNALFLLGVFEVLSFRKKSIEDV